MSGMLMSERFVAVFPSLVRALGSMETAAVLQHLHFNADIEGAIRITMQQISDETGIGERSVRRIIKHLRDEGYVTAERTSAYDATLVYQIDHDRLLNEPAKVADTNRANAQVDVANLAGSEVASLAGSSIQKKEELPTSAVTTEVRTARAPVETDPEQHPARAITPGWAPRAGFISGLRRDFPDIDLRESCRRFTDFYFAKGQTSRSWEADLRRWVSNDAERVRERRSGTDELGVPYGQRPSTVRGSEPGDPEYVDPDELVREAIELAKKSPPPGGLQ